MVNGAESIEMSKVEAGSSTKRLYSPTSLAPDAANVEKFERFTQRMKRPQSPTNSSRGLGHQRPRSIDGRPLRFDSTAQSWSQSPTLGGFPPQAPRKTKLFEYNKIWRSNYTLSLGTTPDWHCIFAGMVANSYRWWRCERLFAIDNHQSIDGRSCPD